MYALSGTSMLASFVLLFLRDDLLRAVFCGFSASLSLVESRSEGEVEGSRLGAAALPRGLRGGFTIGKAACCSDHDAPLLSAVVTGGSGISARFNGCHLEMRLFDVYSLSVANLEA
jgi:hypothetical protein